MYRTRKDIIDKVLYILGVADGYVSAEDSEKVDRNIDGARSTLSGLDIVDVGDVGSLGPVGGQMYEAFFEPFCAFLAEIVAPEFGADVSPSVAARAEMAKATLKTLAAPPRTRRTLRIDPALTRRRSYYNGQF